MADIASSDVTYTIVHNDKDEAGYRVVVADLAFGDGALTYPTGGVPITIASLACPNALLDLVFVEPDAGNGFVYKYDVSAAKIRIYQGDNDGMADGPLVELGGGSATPAAATLRVKVRGY